MLGSNKSREQFLFFLDEGRNADLTYCLARFVEFMHHWEANEKPEYMDIAFSSERSIEDELERETYGDIVTIGKPQYLFVTIGKPLYLFVTIGKPRYRYRTCSSLSVSHSTFSSPSVSHSTVSVRHYR